MKKYLLFHSIVVNFFVFPLSKGDQIEIVTSDEDSLSVVASSVRISTSEKKTKFYKSVKIGKQIWMLENLNISTFRNGNAIPQAKTTEEWKRAGKNKKPAWCYYNDDPKNGQKFGKLYNFYAVTDPRGLAPEGWHIPSDIEWTTLEYYLGSDAGVKMKSTSGWNDYQGESGNGTNRSGFNGLPGGFRNLDGEFYNMNTGGCWWTATEDDVDFAYFRYLQNNFDILWRVNPNKKKGFSVRCIKD